MTQRLKTILVRVEYWDCGNPDHRHKKADIARACIEKREKAKDYNARTRKWTNEAYAAVLKAYREGTRQCDIAKILGLSQTRIREVLVRAQRIERRELGPIPSDPLHGLGTRVMNCLLSQKLRTVDDVRSALAEGRLDDVPNFGKGSKIEVRRWLDELPSND